MFAAPHTGRSGEREGIIADARHTGRNLDAEQTGAALKGPVANARHAITAITTVVCPRRGRGEQH